jgi:hypothetical protein
MLSFRILLGGICLFVFPLVSLVAQDTASLPISADFPELFTARDGGTVLDLDTWKSVRRAEIRDLYERYMYGVRPAVRLVRGTLIREDAEAFGGKAILREVAVEMGLERPVHVMVVLPKNQVGKVPAFLGINFSGNYALVDDPKVALPEGWVYDRYTKGTVGRASEDARGSQREAWAIERTVERGYAVVTFYNGDVVPDRADLAEPVLARIGGWTGERGLDGAGTLMAWAWAFSRVMDYVETVREIDSARVATVGHSRNGKTALLAAAMDERFAMAIPSQSGQGGVGPIRVAADLAKVSEKGRPRAETVAVITKSFPHWFARRFSSFAENPERAPFDQHALVSLCAPRPVLVSNAAEDIWANPAGQWEVLKAAGKVYSLFGIRGLPEGPEPEVGKLFSGRLGYFVRPGGHAMTAVDWAAWLSYADIHLKKL